MADEETTGTVTVDDGMGGEVAVDQGSAQDPFQEWASKQPSDVQERLSNAGVKDFDHLARTWTGAEEARQRMQSERDRLMSQVAEDDNEYDYGDAVNTPTPSMQAESMSLPGMDELLPLFDHDEAKVMDFIAQQRGQELEARIANMLDERLGQYLAPIQQQQVEAQLNEAITEIRATYGEDFEQMAPDVVSLINQQPDLYNSPQGVWAAFGLVQAARHRESVMQQAARRQADTIEGGSGRAPQPDAADEIVKRIMSAGPVKNDGLS